MAEITKKALAASLKKMMSEKPLDKITVIGITDDCGVNRQTFYYHFKDIYDLVEWTYLSEAADILADKKTYDTWQEGFRRIFEYVSENKAFVRNTYHSIGREHLEQFLYKGIYTLMIGVIEEKAVGMSVREEDKIFIARFYEYAFAGLMLEWIRAGMKENPDKIMERLSILIQGDIGKALEKLRMDQKQ